MRTLGITARLLAATAISLLAASPAQAADNGLESHDATPVINPSGTTIEGDKKGIYSDGEEFNLDNGGTIRGNGTTGGVTASDGGVVVTGGPAYITNSGTISGQRFGITTLPFNGTEGRTIGSTIDNSGTIIGDNDDGVRLQGSGTVINSGYIAGRVTAGADGISLFTFAGQDVSGSTSIGSVTNLAGGIIEGMRFGIISGNGGTVDNAGTISGGTAGIVLQALLSDTNKIGTVTNSGTINGAVRFTALAGASLTNSGSITTTTSGSAVNSDSALTVVNSATGSITGATSGITSSGSSLTVGNAGTIRGNGNSTDFNAPNGGVLIIGGPGDVTNSGVISGQRFGLSTFYFVDPMTFEQEGRAIGSTVDNSGSIIGDNEDGVRLIGGGDVTNSGYIAGRIGAGADGISMFAYDDQVVVPGAQIGSVTNSATGIIEGNRHGIILSNGGTVDNAGSITGNASGVHIQAVPTDSPRTGTIVNSGTISGGGVTDFGLANFIVTNSGSITGTIRGINASSAGFTLDNSGTIRGNGTTGGVDFSDGGVVVAGGPADITNSGAITGARFGITMIPYNGAEGRAIGSTIDNSGTIIGDNDDGIRLRGGGDVINSGYIAGRVTSGADGISMFTYDDQVLASSAQIGSVTNLAGGIIEGNRFGIILSNGGTVSNAGTITGFSGAPAQNTGGVHLQAQPDDPGRVGSVTNSGTINGGVSFFGLASSSLNNSGTISSNGLAVLSNSSTTFLNSGTLNSIGGTAVELSGFADSVTLQTGSSINGAVDGGAGVDSLALSGTSSTATSLQTFGNFLNFETLDVQGGHWTAPGTTGTFSSATVNGGTLAVNGSISSPITVASGAVLAGTGTISGNVTVNSGGTLSPGNSIGTINVAGNVNLASGSTFLVETTSTGLSDRLAATGSVTIGSGAALQVLAGSGTYAAQTTYTIVTANSISGKFGTVASDLAFLKPNVAYKSKSVTLTLARNGRPIGSAATLDMLSTATAISAFDESHPLYRALLMQSESGAQQAFEALSGADYGRFDALVADNFGKMQLGFDGAEWAPAAGLAPGFHSGSSFASGPLSVMMVGGRTGGHLSAGSTNGEVDTRFIAGAVGYRSNRFQALAGMTAAWHDGSISRRIAFPGFAEHAGARHMTETRKLEGQVSYALSRGKVGVAPYAAVSNLAIETPAFVETGGFAALAFDHATRSVSQVELGLRMRTSIALGAASVVPHLDVSLSSAWGGADSARSVRFLGASEAFDGYSGDLDGRTARIEGGVDLTAGRLEVRGSYRGRLSDEWQDHSALLSAGLKF
jgi:uncharacterized protein with beta-barrel porin domain